ncbi:MAG: helix-turn-helix transcriptional regulator [Lachnospiraceae bacterium]|nr:helix-turn-helix transcriptional regulator [Lachnospiraceae bacterium]
MTYGTIRIKLDDQLKKSGLSKNKFSQRAEMQRTQLNRYLNNEVSLLDKAVLARMCTVLGCSIADILEFVPYHPGENVQIDNRENSA